MAEKWIIKIINLHQGGYYNHLRLYVSWIVNNFLAATILFINRH